MVMKPLRCSAVRMLLEDLQLEGLEGREHSQVQFVRRFVFCTTKLLKHL